MEHPPDGNALVYCEGAFGAPNGKTAHGLVRKTRRYQIVGVVDSNFAGKDAGEVLDGKARGIPIYGTISEAVTVLKEVNSPATHFVIGLAPDGGRLSAEARKDVLEAIEFGLHVDSGLHDFLSDDPEMIALAQKKNVQLRDVRKTPDRQYLHGFTGKIEEVDTLRIAVLATDSAVGKRTTAWVLVKGFKSAGYTAEIIGTGQTAWMQGAKYGIILDSLINDFVAGEIEHAVWSAWRDTNPDVIVVEGQGSLMNPAYPGGFEILAAARPDVVVLQHAPARKEYDGFPGYALHPLKKQIEAIELLSNKPVVAITVNHEGLSLPKIAEVCEEITNNTGLPAVDVLLNGPEKIVKALERWISRS